MSTPPVLQPLLDALLEAACLIDGSSLRVLAANRSAASLWGCPVGELIGRPVEDLATTPEDQLFWMQLAGWPRSAPLHSDSLIVRADGSRRDVERRISALPLPDGRDGWLLTLVDQTERRRAEHEVERLMGELGATLSSSRDAILVTDLAGQVRCWNPAFARLWRLPRGLDARRESGRIARTLAAALPDGPAYARRLVQQQALLLQARHAPCVDDPQDDRDATGPLATDRIELSDGRTLERRLLPQYGQGEVVGWVQVWRDLTAQLLDQTRLELAGQVFDSILDAVLITDPQGAILSANPAAERLCGRSDAALRGTPLAELLGEADGSALAAHRFMLGTAAPRWFGELQLATPQGPAPVQATLVRSGGDGPNSTGCIAVLRDQRERKAAERQIAELAHTDPLTGLPNRTGLMEQLALATAGAGSTAAAPCALLLVGLDRFKHVNDSIGHRQGDEVLCETGRRLSQGLRLGDQVARLGGDLFGVLLPDSDAGTAEAVARRLLQSLRHDLVVGGLSLALSASVGIALYPHDAHDAAELLAHADRAMHRVKEGHGGDLRFYQPQMNVDRLDHIRLDHAMRRGLAQGDFHLAYQPQVDLASGAVVGVEALCRWTDPDLGAISPTRFIPVAEDTGFITELGNWVLDEAVAQAARWQDTGHALPVSVNVSSLQFQQPAFVHRVARVLQDSRLPPELLELELTESILVGDIDAVLLQLRALAALGVRLAIDDFGTGYSSLGYLKRLPIHRLKIDRSFIQRLPEDASDAAITRAIVELGRALHLRVIAEGVETEAQREHLASLGCDEFQGWLYAPGLDAKALEERLGWDLAQPSLPAWATLAA